MFNEKKIRTIGSFFNMKTTISFLGGLAIGVLFAVPLVERGVLSTDFIANVVEKKINGAQGGAVLEVSKTNKDKEGTVAKNTSFRTGEHSIVVADQPAAYAVVTSMVILGESGWIAIHEETADGAMGSILGARRFQEGTYFGSSIDLLRPTEGGKTYFAILHDDNGDSIFDFETEVPAKDTDGELIRTRFVTSLSF